MSQRFFTLSLVTLIGFASPAQVIARGSKAPSVTPPTEIPRLPPATGTAFEKLELFFERSQRVLDENILPTWQQYAERPSIMCALVRRDKPQSFDFSLLVFRTPAPAELAGPLFPPSSALRIVWYSNYRFASPGSNGLNKDPRTFSELWTKQSNKKTPDGFLVRSSELDLLLRQNGSFIAIESTPSSELNLDPYAREAQRSYGYCFPAEQRDPPPEFR